MSFCTADWRLFWTSQYIFCFCNSENFTIWVIRRFCMQIVLRSAVRYLTDLNCSCEENARYVSQPCPLLWILIKWQYNFPSMPLHGMRRLPAAECVPGTDCACNLIVQCMNKAGSIRKYTPLHRTVSDVIDKI